MSYAPQVPDDKTSRAGRYRQGDPTPKRTMGEDAVPAPKHSAENVPSDYRQVLGWGADLDPANRPAVPRELPSDVQTVRGDVKHWQKPHQKIYVSNEQPGISPVFGETIPARGLSKLMRDYAFEYGEATTRHWMTLMAADRVAIVESMIGEALRGKPDHYIREKGWGVDPRKYATIAAIAFGALGLGLLLAKRR